MNYENLGGNSGGYGSDDSGFDQYANKPVSEDDYYGGNPDLMPDPDEAQYRAEAENMDSEDLQGEIENLEAQEFRDREDEARLRVYKMVFRETPPDNPPANEVGSPASLTNDNINDLSSDTTSTINGDNITDNKPASLDGQTLANDIPTNADNIATENEKTGSEDN